MNTERHLFNFVREIGPHILTLDLEIPVNKTMYLIYVKYFGGAEPVME